jgi:hypothetical protein
VEKGFFFPTDYYIPISAIASADKNGIYLTVSKQDALNQDWNLAPADFDDLKATRTTGDSAQ